MNCTVNKIQYISYITETIKVDDRYWRFDKQGIRFGWGNHFFETYMLKIYEILRQFDDFCKGWGTNNRDGLIEYKLSYRCNQLLNLKD